MHSGDRHVIMELNVNVRKTDTETVSKTVHALSSDHFGQNVLRKPTADSLLPWP